MACADSLLNSDWQDTIKALGGVPCLTASARDTHAFRRPRVLPNPIVMLRLVLAYCLGEGSLWLTAAWATCIGLADISNVGLLYRLRQCETWPRHLVARLLSARAVPPLRAA